jgi:hypothetical protein
MNELDQVIIDLHNSARQVEEEFGQAGAISDDIRKCADRLAEVIKRTEEKGDY